ncbi:MAG: Ig-like domain-containing protein [Terracidiphilus sp.]
MSIAVSPGTGSVVVGATEQFTATATYSDGSTANVTSTASWGAANTMVATINSSGLATGVAAGSTSVMASLSGVSGNATLNVTAMTKTIASIAVSPGTVSFPMGTTQQFTATATYSDGSMANISTTANWTVANTAVATINSSGLASGVASGSTTVSASESGMSGNASFRVTIAPGTGVNIPMWHMDANRSGLNASELSLTPSNVSAQRFGKLFSYLVDGYAYATPLLMSHITIKGTAHNVLYVATEHDSVYAFDADNYGSGAPLWQVSLLQTGETPMTDGPIQPYQGVTSTPVIDPTTNTIYVVSAQTLNGNSSFRLSALDITSGAPKFGSPVTISASVPGTNSDASMTGGIDYLGTSCVQRAALLLENGSVYIGFGGCHAGWLLQYNATTLVQTGKFDMSPNNNGEGPYASAAGVWMGGGGPVADSSGNIYVVTGNGPFVPTAMPTNPPPATAGAWSDSVLKFSPSPSNGMLVLEDYFTPQDYAYMDCADSDLSSGGLLLIPGTSPAQMVAGGKMGKLYFVNSNNLGHESTGDTGAIQTLEWGAPSTPGGTPLVSTYTSSVCPYAPGNLTATINSFEIFGTSAYFNGSIYLGITPTASGIPSGIRQFTYTGGQWVPEAVTAQYTEQNTRGTTPFFSANGTSNGILWMLDQGQPLQNTGTGGTTTATLRAYDANNLSNELYNSNINPSDVAGYGIKFTTPVVGNGKAYISTGHDLTTVTNPQGEIDVYGLN